MPVRLARPDDAPALADVQVAAWRAAYRGLLADAFLDALTPATRLPRWRTRLEAEPGTEVRVFEEGGRLLGYCAVSPSRDGDADPARCAELQAVYVRPESWRSGIGSALCRDALAALRARGATEVTLWVLRQNARARAFYARLGFAPDGSGLLKPRTPEVDLDEVRYRRALG